MGLTTSASMTASSLSSSSPPWFRSAMVQLYIIVHIFALAGDRGQAAGGDPAPEEEPGEEPEDQGGPAVPGVRERRQGGNPIICGTSFDKQF